MEPEEIRHRFSDRLFHWVMAALVLILLGSAFLPILGIHFNWVPIHWISGILLILAIIFHLYRSLFVHGLMVMMPTKDQLLAGISQKEFNDPNKYDLNQKLYHWGMAFTVIVLLVTGALMMVKIDTPFWRRDPSILTDSSWGLVYAMHGIASLLIIFFLILHVYFAFLPEHRDLLISMVFGRRKRRDKGAAE
ncbi:MAG: cytochrome b/b6 domain-containing protein [Pseudomonadota bacterium]|nr:cytochrome b/b6 domain-containing protein [Pseudomonadota bacterium]